MKRTCSRLTLGAVFLWASLDKLADPAAFAEAIFNYRMLPLSIINAVALGLPFLEAACGALLLIGLLCDSCALILAILCGSFALATTSAIMRGLDISCGCFHSQGPSLNWLSPLLDLALLGLAVSILRSGPDAWALDNWLESVFGQGQHVRNR